MAETNREIGEQTPHRLGLTDAAFRLGLSYHQAQRLLLQGKLTGGRGDDGGPWYVDADSVERYLAGQGAA